MQKTILIVLCCTFCLLVSTLQAQVPFTVSIPVQAGNDDAEEKINTGAMDIGSSDLELIRESNDQIVGIRFSNIPLPQGATINAAYIQFTVDETDEEPTSLVLQGEGVADAEPFTATAFDISSRVRTAASVNWNDIPAWTETDIATVDQRTPDLTPILEELINQEDWEAGNAISFIITGSGKRTAISQNKNAPSPATLVIDYDLDEFPVQPFPFDSESVWRYNDEGIPLDTADWTSLSYNDSTWAFGVAEFGYGDNDETTVLDFGPDPNNKIPTYYFRKVFTVADTTGIDSITYRLLRDDGAIVYLNGEEIIRSNMPDSSDFDTFASETVGDVEQDVFFEFKLPANLQAGENVIAVEVHQVRGNSSDLGFDLGVTPDVTLPPAIQLIHNAADPSLQFVDVYVDLFNQGNFVNFTGDQPIPFRAATPYLSDLPAGTHGIAISPTGQDDFMWSAETITLENNKRYIAIASGVRDTSAFNTTVNSGAQIAFRIQLTEVPPNELVGAGETFLLLDHGVPDLPNIRLIAPGVGDATADLPTGLPIDFPLLGGEVPSFDFPLVQVTDNTTEEVFAEYGLNLLPVTGQVATVLASGFFSAEGNTNVNQPNFGTFLVSEAGGFFQLLPEPTPPQAGTLEILHDAPDPGLDSVDIYLNGQLAIEALPFRSSTGRFEVPAGENRVAVSPTGVVDTAWSATTINIDFDLNAATLRLEGFDYSAAAFGLRDTAAFANDSNEEISFGLALTEARTEATDSASVDILIFHGGVNAPAVDVILDGQIIPLVNDLSFGNFAPIYASLPVNEQYQLNITTAEDNQQVVRAYNLDATGLGGQVLTVTASGLLDGEPAFGLFAADGSKGALLPLAEVVIDNIRDLNAAGIKLYPNPVSNVLRIEGQVNTVQLFDVNGQLLLQRQLNGEQAELHLQDLPAGSYFLRVSHQQGTDTARLIKQ